MLHIKVVLQHKGSVKYQFGHGSMSVCLDTGRLAVCASMSSLFAAHVLFNILSCAAQYSFMYRSILFHVPLYTLSCTAQYSFMYRSRRTDKKVMQLNKIISHSSIWKYSPMPTL
jgi:hypothetical protein